jgi:hypothetical protein
MNLTRVIWVLVGIVVILTAFLAGSITTNLVGRRGATFAAYSGYGPGGMMRGGVAPTAPFSGTMLYGRGFGMMPGRGALGERGFGMMPGRGVPGARGFGMMPGRGVPGNRSFGMMPGRGAQGNRGFEMMPSRGWRR